MRPRRTNPTGFSVFSTIRYMFRAPQCVDEERGVPVGVVKQDNSQAARLARVEAQLAIGQLPIRYALAVDQRDLDAWVALFVPDVDMGRHGRGREVLREWIAPAVAGFYRSV